MTKMSLKKQRPCGRAALAGAMAALGVAGAARADTCVGSLSVVDRDTGRAMRLWPHHGRLYVAGAAGARYSLRVANNSDGRVLAVMSVDGVNIVSGETAGYDQRGYVLYAGQSYDASGWRKSNSEVAAFTFAPLSQSYAARTGRPDEVGVIGVAMFTERRVEPPVVNEPTPQWRDQPAGASALAARRAPAPPPPPVAAAKSYSEALDKPKDERLGTAHGAREYSYVSLTNFERASPYPQCVRQIEYDSYDHLVARGVIPRWEGWQRHPRPFPTRPDAGYVPDPPDDE